jgi:hypothetical protein
MQAQAGPTAKYLEELIRSLGVNIGILSGLTMKPEPRREVPGGNAWST